jgi:lysophospholipase L1-like esterase
VVSLWRGVLSLAVFLFVLATVGALMHPAGANARLLSREDSIRVLSLGDSITAGVGAGGVRESDGGYRGTLGKLLVQTGYHVAFVGTRNDYSSAIPNRDHDGWPGYVLRSFPGDPGPGQLYGTVTEHAIDATHPNLILLMAGTNDLLRLVRRVPGYTMPNILNSMDLLLAQIFSEDPQIRIIVAPVDAGLKPIVTRYAKRGDRITLATEMEKAVPRDAAHFPDGIHPSGAGGYVDVAHAWMQAIEQVTAASPATPIAKQ